MIFKRKTGTEKGSVANSIRNSFGTRAFRAGGYSVAAVVIAVAIAVVINMLASMLPSKYTQLDTSATQLLSISEQTELLVSGLQEDVEIYWVVRSGNEDSTLKLLLERYKDLNDHLTVTVKDPDVYPGFVKSYTDSYSDNSLIVISGDRSRYIDYSSIYVTDYSSYYTTGSYTTEFDGEAALTGAIDYVTADNMPKVYLLTGHGEASMSSSFRTAVERENLQLEDLSLLTMEAVPEDADAVLIYGPSDDISEHEADTLLNYMEAGGQVLVIADPPQNGAFTQLERLLEHYGVSTVDGIVVEGDSNHYAWSAPYYLLPELGSHTITEPLSENGYRVILAIAGGLQVSDTLPENVSVTTLLSTSDAAFSKVSGYAMETYEKESDDLDGPFALAVAATETNADGSEGGLVWVASASLLDDTVNEMVSGANQDLFLNTLNWMCGGEESSISIHAKSLSSSYLTISSGTASLLTVLVVALIPLCYLGIGICITIRRKRR